MVWVVKKLLEYIAGKIWTEATMLKAFLKRTFGNLTDTPEHLTPGCQATGAIGFCLPFTSTAICAAHADQLHVHRNPFL